MFHPMNSQDREVCQVRICCSEEAQARELVEARQRAPAGITGLRPKITAIQERLDRLAALELVSSMFQTRPRTVTRLVDPLGTK